MHQHGYPPVLAKCSKQHAPADGPDPEALALVVVRVTVDGLAGESSLSAGRQRHIPARQGEPSDGRELHDFKMTTMKVINMNMTTDLHQLAAMHQYEAPLSQRGSRQDWQEGCALTRPSASHACDNKKGKKTLDLWWGVRPAASSFCLACVSGVMS